MALLIGICIATVVVLLLSKGAVMDILRNLRSAL